MAKRTGDLDYFKRALPQINGSYFLFGPRGTGKSTWLRHNFPDALYIDLLSPDLFRQYSAQPERLRDLIAGNPKIKTIIIDEVQKVPQILPVVHQLIEEKKEYQFILTGSSARKLKRTGVDLLAGRAILATCHPFIASEMGDLFSLDRALDWGMLPLVYGSDNPLGVLKTYAALYLREEVQAEGLVRNIGSFSRFLETISFSHGSVLNTSAVARDCSVGRKTAEGYIEILEDLLLSFRLPVFRRRAKRNLVSHSKFYYFDAGVYISLRPKGPLDSPEEIRGLALEGLIAQHLLAWISYDQSTSHTLSYWRTKSGTEVDFVIYGEKMFAAIEVKHSAKVNNQDLKGLKAFQEDYPEATLYFLYQGKEKLKIGNVLCLPCESFLKELIPGKLF